MRKLRTSLVLALALGACDGKSADPRSPGSGGTPITPMTPVEPDLAALKANLAAVPRTADQLLQAHAVQFLEKLPYDPGKAINLDKIQASALAIEEAERAVLQTRGFVLSDREKFLTFTHGYQAIYAEHLPVYVSADSVLYALHRSYDAILRTIEERKLIMEMDRVLEGARVQLQKGPIAGISDEAHKDVDLFLAVAVSLLRDTSVAPIAGGDAAAVSKLVLQATRASGQEPVTLFGTLRTLDFSQFTPRGHYTRSPDLVRYFRALIWLGRTELRLIETLEDGSQVFRRRQLEGAVLLRTLVDQEGLSRWKTIDQVIRAFVGEPDDMTLTDIDRLMADLGAANPADLTAKSDEVIAAKIVEKGYGVQRISSQIMINGLDQDTLPLSRSFLFFGQRYVLDSHVFSNVVYDRVKKAKVKRMMPDPLDAAFAALGNDAAAALLAPGLRTHDYASELASVRLLADAHGPDFWGANLYNRWLGALRSLSPEKSLRVPETPGLPSVARTEAWSRRILNTQLASWAELRHDTILYVKQSYTGGIACEFPDAYVDPYPAFWRALAALGKEGGAMIATLGLSPQEASHLGGYFTELESTARILAEMADRQQTGQRFTAEQLAFINQAVSLVPFGCGQQRAEGWYPKLFFERDESLKLDPTIADVHTQPTDEGGNRVGKVLHVGTGRPRLMVVTAETCSGPRAYMGLASSYFERVTMDFKRLDDMEWSAEIRQDTPTDVPWMTDLVVR